MLSRKRILLIIGGGIAAYKCLSLVRLLRDSGADVSCVATKAAEQFVTPLSLAALSESQVHQELFNPLEEAKMGHIELSRSADLLVVAPATADILAKMAGGLADDLASTLLLATDKPVLAAPAMNVRMWLNPATRRNVATLESDGITMIGPETGPMACGETGPGRMAEPDAIVDAIRRAFATGRLANKHIVVTSGPTREPIDPVRYIANKSSGKQGTAIAQALVRRGAKVTFVTGPASVEPPAEACVVRVESAREMLDAVQGALPAEAAIFAAAVVDWRVRSVSGSKIKKQKNQRAPSLELVENPDILATIAKMEAGRPRLVVGFAAETDNVEENARSKLLSKGCDWIVANCVTPESGVFGGDENKVALFTAAASESWPRLSKDEIGSKLADRICAELAE